MTAALKSLFDNSHIFVTSMLASVDCLFSFELFVLVWEVIQLVQVVNNQQDSSL